MRLPRVRHQFAYQQYSKAFFRMRVAEVVQEFIGEATYSLFLLEHNGRPRVFRGCTPVTLITHSLVVITT